MQEICKKHPKICQKISKNRCNMQINMHNMQEICKKYAKNMQKIMLNMQKICTLCKKYAEGQTNYVTNMQHIYMQNMPKQICKICSGGLCKSWHQYAKCARGTLLMAACGGPGAWTPRPLTRKSRSGSQSTVLSLSGRARNGSRPCWATLTLRGSAAASG